VGKGRTRRWSKMWLNTGQEDGLGGGQGQDKKMVEEVGKGQDKKMIEDVAEDRTRRWSRRLVRTGQKMVEDVTKDRTQDG
jgi:hypothetical protein